MIIHLKRGSKIDSSMTECHHHHHHRHHHLISTYRRAFIYEGSKTCKASEYQLNIIQKRLLSPCKLPSPAVCMLYPLIPSSSSPADTASIATAVIVTLRYCLVLYVISPETPLNAHHNPISFLFTIFISSLKSFHAFVLKLKAIS